MSAFRAQKVTNGNANEVITNYMIKNGLTIYGIDTDEEYLKRFIKDKYEEKEDRQSVSGLIQRLTNSGEHRNIYMPFKYRRWKTDDISALGSSPIKIKEDMIKDGYTFTSISNNKFKEAVLEIYIRTSVHVN